MSGSPSWFKSRIITDRPQSNGGRVNGTPSSSINVPLVNDSGIKLVPPMLRKIPSTSPSSSMPPAAVTTKRSTSSGSVVGRPLTDDTYCFPSGPFFIQKRALGMSISARVR